MKIVTYLHRNEEQLGFFVKEKVYSSSFISNKLPSSMQELLEMDITQKRQMQAILNEFEIKAIHLNNGLDINQLNLCSPLPRPNSFRDAYAFRQHVETSRINRGLQMIPEFDEFPVFYFSNHRSIVGPGPVFCMNSHFNKLDFELEVAIIIDKKGKNIKADQADEYIGGFVILNDFSAREEQMKEMKLNLGPAKGKDFASAIGPYYVSKDELKPYIIKPLKGHIGNAYDLEMKCSVNGCLVSVGNLSAMHWTFAEIIERASYGVNLYPGDIIGSGTVGTGCFLELNGTAKRKNPNYKEQWLEPGDRIEMEVTGLGKLTNQVLLGNN